MEIKTERKIPTEEDAKEIDQIIIKHYKDEQEKHEQKSNLTTKGQMGEIDFKKILLERFEFARSQYLDDVLLSESASLEIITDFVMRHLVLEMRVKILGEKLGDINWPTDWKEAFKERWFPKWLLKKYPVKYTKIDLFCLYPKISLPNREHYITYSK